MSLCFECSAPIDPHRPTTVRVYVKCKDGKERELCVSCWSGDSKQPVKKVRR